MAICTFDRGVNYMLDVMFAGVPAPTNLTVVLFTSIVGALDWYASGQTA